MTTWTDHLQSKMSWKTGKSPGWAAFDCKQRKKHGDDLECDVDPYPPMTNVLSSTPTVNIRDTSSTLYKSSLDRCDVSTSVASNLIMTNYPARSFSSVVKTSMDSPILNNSKSRITADNFSSSLLGHEQNDDGSLTIQIPEETNRASIIEKLKMHHTWADNSLINDILVAVNNDEDQAWTLLSSMVSAVSEGTVHAEASMVLVNSPVDKKIEQVEQGFLTESQLVDGSSVKLNLGQLASVPIEPEWVEDDIYLSHRKDAIRMTRLAAQHSLASNNSFARGDHFEAQQLSLKARDEWLAAEKLNAKAAEEILHIRNSRNDVWKLDLHGLHASEAVHALEAHLNKIESHILTTSDRIIRTKAEIGHSSSPAHCGHMGTGGHGHKEEQLPRQRHSVLQVITGTGNHSRGEAALPAAVRSFLITNGYRFHEVRPGVIAIRPKFRHR